MTLAIGQRFTSVMTSAHVLAETSNLLAQTNDRQKTVLLNGLALWIDDVREQGTASNVATLRPEYARLGLTDAMLILLTASGATLLTADLPLYQAASRAGCHAVNYNYVRDGALDIEQI